MKWLLDLLHALTLWLDSSTTETPHRVAEASHAVKWERFSTIQRSVLETIARQDNETQYAPDMSNDISDDSPLGKLRHVANITSTLQSVLRIVADPSGRQFVAKFVSDCYAKYRGKTDHSNLVEYSIQAALNDTGIAPKVYFMSPPAPIVRGFPMKARSTLMATSAEECIQFKPELRMIVMDIAGPSVNAYLSYLGTRLGLSAVYFRAALRIALKTLTLIESLHSHGVVHGDIHGGNIVFRVQKKMDKYNLDTDELILIDFGMSSFFPDALMSPEDVLFDNSANPRMMTPWQLVGKRYGRRDDVFKLLGLVAFVLSNGKVDAAVAELLTGSNPMPTATHSSASIKKAWQEYKSRYSLFIPNEYFRSGCCVATGLVDQSLRKLHISLEMLVEHVRAINHPDDEPNYAFISGAFRSIIQSF